MENLVKIIKNEFENGNNHLFVGFRGLTEDESYKVGDTARDSYEWDLENDCSTYYTTGETADGTCAIGGEVEWLDEDEEIIEKLTQWKNEIAYYGETDDVVFLIGESEGEYGTRDENEVRIIDPIVAAFV